MAPNFFAPVSFWVKSEYCELFRAITNELLRRRSLVASVDGWFIGRKIRHLFWETCSTYTSASLNFSENIIIWILHNFFFGIKFKFLLVEGSDITV
jgi:hypothetical protein